MLRKKTSRSVKSKEMLKFGDNIETSRRLECLAENSKRSITGIS